MYCFVIVFERILFIVDLWISAMNDNQYFNKI